MKRVWFMKIAVPIFAAFALGIAAFAGVRHYTTGQPAAADQVSIDPTVAAEPTQDLTATPDASATPDRSQPGWYVPYLNREREFPAFSGVINNIEVGQENLTPAEWAAICTEPSFEAGPDAEERWADSPLTFDEHDLPPEMELFERPIFTVCPDAGVVRVTATVRVHVELAGESPASGGIEVQTSVGRTHAGIAASEERWVPTTISGLPAAALRPVIDDIGDSAIIVYDESADVTTLLYGTGLYLESLELLAEEIVQSGST